jgi:hypothetical protein
MSENQQENPDFTKKSAQVSLERYFTYKGGYAVERQPQPSSDPDIIALENLVHRNQVKLTDPELEFVLGCVDRALARGADPIDAAVKIAMGLHDIQKHKLLRHLKALDDKRQNAYKPNKHVREYSDEADESGSAGHPS